MTRLLLVLTMVVTVTGGSAAIWYLLASEPAAEARSPDMVVAQASKAKPVQPPAAKKALYEGLETKFATSNAKVEAGPSGEVRIIALPGLAEHYVWVGPLKAIAGTSTLTFDVRSFPSSFLRIQLLDKATKGIFADVDLEGGKVVMQRLEPIGRPTAELTKVDANWRRITIKGDFGNEERKIIIQLMKGLGGGTGFASDGEGVAVRAVTLN
jgi:hypothetical protein